MNERKSYIYAILAVLLWSTVATAFKIALSEVSPNILLLGATLSSLIILLIINAYRYKMQIFIISKKELINSAYLGFLNPFIYYILLFEAYYRLPAQEALTLNYAWAAILVLLSIPLLKRKISLVNLSFLFISFFGVIIIASHGNITTLKFEDPIGTLIALSSAFVWALYWIFNFKDKREADKKLLYNFFFGALYIFLYCIISSEEINLSLQSIIAISYVGFFEMGITFIFWSKAMEYAKYTNRIGSLVYISPFLSILIISYILNEPILKSTIIGVIFIVVGIILSNISKQKN